MKHSPIGLRLALFEKGPRRVECVPLIIHPHPNTTPLTTHLSTTPIIDTNVEHIETIKPMLELVLNRAPPL